MSVPFGAFEEDGKEGGAAEDGVEGQAFEEAVQGVCTALGEVGAEAVAADVLHFMFVRERGNGGGGVFSGEGFVEEHEVSEAAADGEGGFLEGFEVGLEGVG